MQKAKKGQGPETSAPTNGTTDSTAKHKARVGIPKFQHQGLKSFFLHNLETLKQIYPKPVTYLGNI